MRFDYDKFDQWVEEAKIPESVMKIVKAVSNELGLYLDEDCVEVLYLQNRFGENYACAKGYQLGKSAGWFDKPYFLCCCSRDNFAFVPDVQFMPKKIIGVGTLGFFIDTNGVFHEKRDCNVEYSVSHFEERFEKLEKEFYDYVDSL